MAGITVLPEGPDKKNMIFIIIFGFFVMGVNSSGRASVGYCYMMEITPSRYRDSIGSTWLIMEAFINIWTILYYLYINKDWRFAILFGALLALISFINILIFVPESPKWLYS